ncbi:MAG: aldolase/citrate lyase family protein [bacterium]|nr:aldolase/citrate lyase family protein [bacterium]MDE0289209.1 aldolase/citrate lyase family protein [bacterium]MDE0437420.1 aldolase/citrate lyase family protein [bacterium]
MRRNHLRELLDADQPTLGTHILSSWPSIVELVGLSGMFDYVEFVAEYGPYDLYSLENLGRAVDLFDHMSSMMKIEQEPRTYLAVRALGSGIQNVLFSDPRTVEDVEECVSAVRAEAPGSGGRHGVGMRRDVGLVLEAGTPAFVEALDQAVVALMIEKDDAVENLEALLSVGGVDMVQFGPADYSMSIGLAGQFDHPRVREAEEHVIATALRMGIAPRAELRGREGMERYLDLGVKHFCIGTDVKILFDWLTGTGGRIIELLGREPPGSVHTSDRYSR